jgi:hypothetical protein
MTAINVAAFWPFFTNNELRRFDYVSVDGSVPPITSVFSYDIGTASMLLNDYDEKAVWKDRWYYQYRPGFGIAEWRDDYPGKKVVLSPAIGWGDQELIGGTYINYPKMSLFYSWPPTLGNGCQIVAYEKLLPTFANTKGLYSNVLQFTYLQSWSGKPATGARYWMAKDIGPVSLEWIAQDPQNPTGKPLIVTSRMDALITSVYA